MKHVWTGFGLFTLMIAPIGCSDAISHVDPETASETSQTAAALGSSRDMPRGTAVTRWVGRAMQVVRDDAAIGTPAAGRLYAMVTVAMYDAVNAIDRAQSRGREQVLVSPSGAPQNGHRAAAAAAAAHAVLVVLAPAQAPALDAALEEDLQSLEPWKTVLAGRAWGQAVGEQVVALRSDDGTQSPEIIPAGIGPGAHRANFDARWRNMTPFGIDSKEPYVSPPPPALESDEYAAAFHDVKTFGQQDGDSERNEISSFWVAEAGTPRETGVWLQAALAIAEQERTVRSISDTARLFASVAMGIADSVITSWETKARYFTWRPTVAIREADTDGNPNTQADPTWSSRTGSVGASPEYNSGLSTVSAAASVLIEAFYRTWALPFCFETDSATNGPRCYSNPLEAAKEAGRSRIYQGIHFQFSNQAGRISGFGIGLEIAATQLRPIDYRHTHH